MSSAPSLQPVFAHPGFGTPDEAALALLGHDLRAALSDVLGGLRLISPEDLPGPARLQVERVRAAGELLARLLEQGLTVMLGEAEQAPLEVVELRHFLQDIDLRLSGRASEKNLGFALNLGPDLPQRLRIDRVGLERILSNIVGNAIKYCDEGEVTCHVARDPGGGLSITVRDDGPGFPPATLGGSQPAPTRPGRPHLSGRSKSGSGMGLRIAKDLTARLGGQLLLRNPDEGGAEVRLILPPQAEPEADDGPAADHGHDMTALLLAGKRVLVADDNQTSQAILSSFATKLGGEVVVVDDGVEAIEWLTSDSVDLLIIDIEMPRLSGLEVIRILRAMPGLLAELPIIAATAYTLRSNRDAILAAGANAILAKPLLCANVFAGAVRSVLDGTAFDDSTPPLPPPSDHRLSHLLEMAGPQVALELLTRLIDDLHGVERGLVQGGAGPHWRLLHEKSHVLISLAGAVGADLLQHRAETLNQLSQHQDPARLSEALSGVMSLLDPLIQHIVQLRDSRAPAE